MDDDIEKVDERELTEFEVSRRETLEITSILPPFRAILLWYHLFVPKRVVYQH